VSNGLRAADPHLAKLVREILLRLLLLAVRWLLLLCTVCGVVLLAHLLRRVPLPFSWSNRVASLRCGCRSVVRRRRRICRSRREELPHRLRVSMPREHRRVARNVGSTVRRVLPTTPSDGSWRRRADGALLLVSLLAQCAESRHLLADVRGGDGRHAGAITSTCGHGSTAGREATRVAHKVGRDGARDGGVRGVALARERERGDARVGRKGGWAWEVDLGAPRS
jgi:hypothetical protein